MTQLKPINPNTGEPLPALDCTPVEEIAKKVEAARRAQAEWSSVPFEDRVKIVREAGKRIGEKLNEIAGIVTEEMGKLPTQAQGEVKFCVDRTETDIETMRKAIEPEELPFKGGVTTVHQVPLGVAGLITPWNFPALMPVTLFNPALLAGDTIVYKPSEIVTRTGLAIAEIYRKLLPENVLLTVVGADDQGKAIVESDVDLIGFIGSREVGKQILTKAGRRGTRVVLEMGGKDPMVVGKDANLDKAAAYAARGAFRNTGQVCCAVERIYVERDAEEAFTKKLLEKRNEVAVGEDVVDRLAIGPFALEHQLKHVEAQLADAKSKGAKILAGGKRIDKPGYWFEPTVITNLTEKMDITTKETFGPVAAIHVVDSVDEGIREANNTRYGLAASIWMGDEARAREKALQLEAGSVGVNRSFGGHHDAPWAGAKESGYNHTCGVSGMRNFLQPRSVTVQR